MTVGELIEALSKYPKHYKTPYDQIVVQRFLNENQEKGWLELRTKAKPPNS
jgi:hypothetical protein